MEKRAKIQSKPRRITIGPTCPVCNAKEPARGIISYYSKRELDFNSLFFFRTCGKALQWRTTNFRESLSRSLCMYRMRLPWRQAQDFGHSCWISACKFFYYHNDQWKQSPSYWIDILQAKLDIILQDKNLINQKRASYFAKPKKLSIGPTCPVCDLRFTKSQNRDHVGKFNFDANHFT